MDIKAFLYKFDIKAGLCRDGWLAGLTNAAEAAGISALRLMVFTFLCNAQLLPSPLAYISRFVFFRAALVYRSPLGLDT